MAASRDRTDLVRAFEAARQADDVDAMAAAALRLAAERRFGAPLGGVGYLHEAYARATGSLRVRLGVELARAWVYTGEPARAAPFAREALAEAERLDLESSDPPLLAAALDADLLTHWGPDDLAERISTSQRLDAVAGHLTDVETRLSAALWRLTTALETLDVVTVRRQLRLLDSLGEESGSARVRMFAASRRGMHALVVGDLEGARRLAREVAGFGAEAEEPDTEALVHVLDSGVARQTGDRETLAAQAAAYEHFGTEHGVRSIVAEAAVFWLDSGDPERARTLLEQIVAGGSAAVPRDVDWLLNVATAVEVAAATGLLDVAAEGVALLTPYAGRAVVNAGAVAFVGVVDDYLRIACSALGRADEAAQWEQSAARHYRRLDAAWWLRRLTAAAREDPAGSRSLAATAVNPPMRAVLAPDGDGVWLVGLEGRAVATRAMKGFRYLRLLLERPGVELAALELSAAVTGVQTSVGQSGLGEVVDRRALAAYRRRLAELDDELDEARSWADPARAGQLAAERGMLLDEIAAATGLGGRPRVTGATSERARVAVQKSISAAIARIAEADEHLGRLLRDGIRTGATCCYDPDPARPVQWTLNGPVGQ